MLYDANLIRSGDELLGPNVTNEILAKAEGWLISFANRLGVEKEDIEPGFLVQELMAAYSYREICFLKSYGMRKAFQSNEDGDYYSRKLVFFERRIRDLENRLTANDLTGGKSGQGWRATEIARG